MPDTWKERGWVGRAQLAQFGMRRHCAGSDAPPPAVPCSRLGPRPSGGRPSASCLPARLPCMHLAVSQRPSRPSLWVPCIVACTRCTRCTSVCICVRLTSILAARPPGPTALSLGQPWSALALAHHTDTRTTWPTTDRQTVTRSQPRSPHCTASPSCPAPGGPSRSPSPVAPTSCSMQQVYFFRFRPPRVARSIRVLRS